MQLVISLVIGGRGLKAHDLGVLSNGHDFFEVEPDDTFEYFHIARPRDLNCDRRPLRPHHNSNRKFFLFFGWICMLAALLLIRHIQAILVTLSLSMHCFYYYNITKHSLFLVQFQP